MVMGSKRSGGVKKEYTPFQNAIWMACCAATMGAILCQAISIYMNNWREAGGITYNYIHKASKRQHLVEPTRYGLHTVVYDNHHARQSWAKRVSNVKAKGYMAIQNSSQNHRGGYDNFFVNECPAACRDAIAVRIKVYENLLGYNNLLITVLSVTSVVAGLGVAWYIFVGKNLGVVGGAWMISGVFGGGATILWNRYTHKTWIVAVKTQMLPFPYVSTCYRVTVLSNFVIVCSALALFFSDVIGVWYKKKMMQSELKHFLEKQNNLGFENGLMAGMGPQIPNFNMPTVNPGMPMMKQAVTPGAAFNPGAMFNGMGFNNNMRLGNPTDNKSPSMWERNFK